MSLRMEQIQTEGIAQLSYLVGDDAKGIAAVIDPRRDVEIYLESARRMGLAITHIFETHIHADFVSGSRELAARLGGSAQIYVSGEGGARYGFDVRTIKNGQTFELGKIQLTARHTPGHTPEHVAYEVSEKNGKDGPWGVLTGDSLFVNSAGRPDLLGSDQTDNLADQLFHTMNDYFLKLHDSVIIYPGHGHGSPCGADIGDRLSSTIGHERRHNPFLQFEDKDEFKQYALATAPPVPTYYPLMKKINAEGPEILGAGPSVPALAPPDFQQAVRAGKYALVDTRSMLGFGGGHIAGAINIGGNKPLLSIWAGWLLDPEQPLLLVLDDDQKLPEILKLFIRTGFDKFAGYLAGGMGSWITSGMPLHRLEQITVHEIDDQQGRRVLLDVRSPEEWKKGRIPDAQHFFLGRMLDEIPDLDKKTPIATYCASGYRASIAASLLRARGFNNVANIPGSWEAWTAAGLPVEKPEAAGPEGGMRHAA